MREIKLRQPHRCQNGHFAYLYFELIGDKVCNHKWGEHNCKCPRFAIGEGFSPCGKTELCTNLKDKHGKDIYEGDIVRYCATDFAEGIGRVTVDEGIIKVPYIDELLNFNKCNEELWKLNLDDECEIIGDIHTTPELLEV